MKHIRFVLIVIAVFGVALMVLRIAFHGDRPMLQQSRQR